MIYPFYLGIYPREIKASIHTLMFTAALFPKPSNWKQLMLLAGELTNCGNTVMEYY